MIKVTRSNYFDLKVEREYMSRSQYNGFLDCEAAEMARLAGEWKEEKSTPLLVGSYVHAWSEGRRDEFIKEHPEMFTQKGELKKDFQCADKMIAALESDPLCMYALTGEKEVIVTGEFAGVIWKIMLDVKNRGEKRIVDLKTTRSIRERFWNPDIGEKQSFVEQYKYPRQSAIYSEIDRIADGRPEGDWWEFYIVAVSKEPVPDKEVIYMHDPERYWVELEEIKLNMPRILEVKSGLVTPQRCEKCDYCLSTKKLKKPIYYRDL